MKKKEYRSIIKTQTKLLKSMKASQDRTLEALELFKDSLNDECMTPESQIVERCIKIVISGVANGYKF